MRPESRLPAQRSRKRPGPLPNPACPSASVVPSAAGTTILQSMIALAVPMCTFIAAPGVDVHIGVLRWARTG
jgi:hypothetical protein